MCCIDCPENKKCTNKTGCCSRCRYYNGGNCVYSEPAGGGDTTASMAQP